MTTETKKSFVEKVLAFVNGGDEGKVKRFHKQLKKWLEKQITAAKDQITEIDDKIADRQEELNELIVGVDVSRLNKIEGIHDYIDDYVDAWDEKYLEIKKLEDEKAELTQTIEQRQMQLESIK